MAYNRANVALKALQASPNGTLPTFVFLVSRRIMRHLASSLALLSTLYLSVKAIAVPGVEPTPTTPVYITSTPRGLDARAEPTEGYGYSLIGCYDELNYPVRVLNHQVPWDKVSVSSCVNACFNAGPYTGLFGPHYLFAGVINGDQCWCDNVMNVKAVKVDQGRCNHLCENGPNEYCGGSREYQLYYRSDTGLNPVTLNPANPPSVGAGSGYYAFKGCWPDNPHSRVLNGLSYSSEHMTPLYCAHICWAQRFIYSGVEYGRECWCGNTLNVGSAAPVQECNQACEGDSTFACGAPNYIGIYQGTPRS